MSIKKSLTLLSLLCSTFVASANEGNSAIYAFKIKNLAGTEVDFNQYKGKVLLIVNTASNCGFTAQYKGLEQLWKTYGDRGLVVLGFPCNQFGGQEPGTAAEIQTFCTTKFSVSFPMFEKIEVNGPNAHPLYNFLKSSAPGLLGTEGIKWNFTKFLVDREGKVVNRFASNTKPEKLNSEIEALLTPANAKASGEK